MMKPRFGWPITIAIVTVWAVATISLSDAISAKFEGHTITIRFHGGPR